MKSVFDNNENQEVISEINVTPLVDVMLILMIIFLITAPLLISNIDISLPKAAGSQSSIFVEKKIEINKEGLIKYEGSKVNILQLSEIFVKNHTSNNNELSIKIYADKDARYEDVASVLSLISKNNITNVGFVVQE